MAVADVSSGRLQGLALSWFFAPYLGSADLDFFKRIKDCAIDFDVVQLARAAADPQVLQFTGAASLRRIEVQADHANPRSRDTRDTFRDAALRTFEARRDDYDFLISHSNEVPSHAAARECKRLRPDLPWVAYFGDVVRANPYVQFTTNYPLHDEDCETEARTLEEADLVICNNTHQRDAMFSGPLRQYRSKATVIPHAFEPAMFRPRPHRVADRHRFAHVGTLYHVKRVARPVLEAVDRLLEFHPEYAHRFEVSFWGGGYYPSDFEAHAQMRHGDHVHLHGRVGYLESLELMQDADTLINIDAVFEPTRQLPASPFFPGKLADYMGAARPILSISMQRGPTAELMHATGNTVCSDAVDDIAAALKASIDAPPRPPSGLYARYSTHVVGPEMSAAIQHAISSARRPRATPTPRHESPTLTVIVRTQHDAAYIERCLSSLQRQTLTSLEVLVLDDGCAVAGDRVLAMDARFVGVEVFDESEEASTQRAVALARGEYVVAVDGDDRLEPDELHRMVVAAKTHDADVVVSANEGPTAPLETGRLLTLAERAQAIEGAHARRRWLFSRQKVATGALKPPPRISERSSAAPQALLLATRVVECRTGAADQRVGARTLVHDLDGTIRIVAELLAASAQSDEVFDAPTMNYALAQLLPHVEDTRTYPAHERIARLRRIFAPLDDALGGRWLGAALRKAAGRRRALLIAAARPLGYAPIAWSWDLPRSDEAPTTDDWSSTAAPRGHRSPLRDRLRAALVRRLRY